MMLNSTGDYVFSFLPTAIAVPVPPDYPPPSRRR
jgi:hypothetical protein